MPNTVIEVSKNQNETNASLIRRFTKRVQDSGILKRARSLRYSKRKASPYAKKKSALSRLEKRLTFERLKRLGKIDESVRPRTFKR